MTGSVLLTEVQKMQNEQECTCGKAENAVKRKKNVWT